MLLIFQIILSRSLILINVTYINIYIISIFIFLIFDIANHKYVVQIFFLPNVSELDLSNIRKSKLLKVYRGNKTLWSETINQKRFVS